MHRSSDEVPPLHRVTINLLASLTDRWTTYTAVAVNEPAERSITRVVEAGLVEAFGVLAFTKEGSDVRLVIEGRWSGTIREEQVPALLVAVPEWFEKGKLTGRVVINVSIQKLRLTHEGLIAQKDMYDPEHQYPALQIIWGNGLPQRISPNGRISVDLQRVERPLPPTDR